MASLALKNPCVSCKDKEDGSELDYNAFDANTGKLTHVFKDGHTLECPKPEADED